MGRKGPRPDAVAAELDKLRGVQTDGKVNLGDATYIKRALDDGAIKILTEHGYSEDTTLTDTKIGLGIATCALALLAQFYPEKYPKNFWLLVLCVGLYAVLSAIQNAIFGRIGGDVFFQAKLNDETVLCVLSKMARYSEDYELSIGKRPNVWSGKQGDPVSVTKKVTEFFDTEGTLLESRFKPVVLGLLSNYEKKYKNKR